LVYNTVSDKLKGRLNNDIVNAGGFMKEKALIKKLDDYFAENSKSKSFLLAEQESGVTGCPSNTVDTFVAENRKTETFPVLLNRMREEKALEPAELYKKAFIDRKLYSQIMGERHYQPSKNTAIAFGLALELPYENFKVFLQSAGFALNHNSDFDLVIKFCVQNGIYDINDVNELLESQNQPCLR
jgi:hypothetical protein